MEANGMTWQGTGRHLGMRRPRIALGIAVMVLAAALTVGTSESAQARDSIPSNCVVVPNGSGGRAICTYLDAASIDLSDLVSSVGGDANASGVWIQAWGGAGAAAPDNPDSGGHDGGAGGGGGYAQTYYNNLSSLEQALGTDAATLYNYYGGNGTAKTDVLSAGGGGASTLVTNSDVTEDTGPDYGPCIAADPEAFDQDGIPTPVDFYSGNGALCSQSVVALAGGGGGGGGTSGDSRHGLSGGAGGTAIASSFTTVGRGADGDSQYPKRAGVGGFAGQGGHNHKFDNGDGGDGIGGLGGPYSSSSNAGETAGTFVGPAFIGGETNGQGGRAYANQGNFGGGGGGGFGGGGGGGGASSSGHAPGSGGGGGGSYAYGGDAPSAGTPPTGAPSADQGAVRVVIDGIPEPMQPLAACAVTQHGTGAAETLVGTTGGDAIFGHGGTDSIVAGPGDDCAYGGADGDVTRGGRGNDLLFGDGGAGGSGGAGGCCASVPSTRRGARSALRAARKDADTIKGGRGADRIIGEDGRNTLRGGRGADMINAEGGRQAVHGGRGADRIHARDSKRDVVHCGPGHDIAWVDATDRVARNCEVVHT